MSDALYNRLQNLRILEDEDRPAIERLLADIEQRPAGDIVIEESGPIHRTRIILSGWAIRFRTLEGGERQILNFLLPGDSIGLYGALFPSSDWSVELITECRLAEFPCEELIATCQRSPRIGAALCWIGGQDERVLEQQILRIGSMNATARIAHLLLELHRRMLFTLQRRDGTIADREHALHMPLTQPLIGEALGLSTVHVNRCCRRLAQAELLECSHGAIHLLDPAGLEQYCGVDTPFSTGTSIPSSLVRKLETD